MKKKGISPLIATVLIIGFTIALAAIIITWSTGFTKRMQTQTEETANVQVICATDVVFDIKSVCTDDDTTYKLLVQNDGKEDIKSWKLRVYQDANTVQSTDSDTSSSSFGIGTITWVITDSGLTKVRKFEMFPIIEKSGKDVVCSSNIDAFGDEYGTASIEGAEYACT